MNNKELVEKAVVTTDALAAAGKLNPEQADRFIDYVIDVTKLKGMARIVRFKPEQYDIDKIGVGQRVTVPKAEATDPGVRRNVQTSKVSLRPVEVMTPFEISDEFSEVNIEGDNVQDHIVKMMATQMANDLEDFYLNADTVGPAAFEDELVIGGSSTQVVKDGLMSLLHGWLRLADGANIVDAAGADISSALFSKMIKAMPEKFKRDRGQLRYMTSSDIEQNYREAVSTRATAAGDAALSTTGNLTPFGIQLVPVPLLGTNPKIVENATMTGVAAQALRYKPILSGSVIVTPNTLGNTPVTPYIEGTDYSVDYVNGTVTRIATGSITDAQVVKVTYRSYGQAMLTHFQNLIIGISRDIRIEKDRDIFKGVNQYAITTKVSVQIEELTAVVKMKNIGLD